jgi:two-component system, LuxR family, response regulator FixJ
MLSKSNQEASASSAMAERASVSPIQITPLGAEIFIVDDDPMIGDLLNGVFSSEGYRVTTFGDGDAFIAVARSRVPPACLIIDFLMPGRSGLDILQDIDAHNYAAPVIVMSGMGGIPMAIEAIKNGAFDFLEKPFALDAVVERVRYVIVAWMRHRMIGISENLETKFPNCQPLTLREVQVLAEIVEAASNREAAQRLGISPRTIEVHRAHIMTKLGAKNTADLVRIALANRYH